MAAHGPGWGTKTVNGASFSHAFAPDAKTVRFAFALPYQEADLKRFLAPHRGNRHVAVRELCKTRKGRSVERIHIGKLDGRPAHRLLITCRHHSCESTASYVLEGILSALLAETSDGRWFRENVEVLAVPFMDKDGVEDGDQGKNRKAQRPWPGLLRQEPVSIRRRAAHARPQVVGRAVEDCLRSALSIYPRRNRLPRREPTPAHLERATQIRRDSGVNR